jgi:hypothetical protein
VTSHSHRISGSFCPSYAGNDARPALRLACSGSDLVVASAGLHYGWRPLEMIKTVPSCDVRGDSIGR